MDEIHFHALIAAEKAGLKAEAKRAAADFVAAAQAAPETVRRDWVYAHVSDLPRNRAGRTRHEIFEGVLRPVLAADYLAGRLEALIALARCENNLSTDYQGWAEIGVEGAVGLWREAYALAPDNSDVCAGLLHALVRGLSYTTHEWPSGLLLGPDDPEVELDEIDSDLVLIRKLDTEGRYGNFVEEVADMVRTTRHRRARR